MPWSNEVAGWLATLLLVASPLAIGGAPLVVRLSATVGAGLVLALVLVGRISYRRPLVLSGVFWPLAIAVLATVLQIAPLPASLVAWLSPAAHELLSKALGAYDWHSLSLDARASAVELCKLAGYAAFLAGCVGLGKREHRRRRLLVAVAAVGTIAAVIGLLQAALHTNRVLFLYELATARSQPGWRIFGTFVNPNHFGGLMCLSAPVALVLGLREPRLRLPAFLALFVMNAATVASLSRSSIVLVPLAQVLALVIERAARRRESGAENQQPGRDARGLLVLAMAASIGVAVVLAGDLVAREIRHTREVELDAPLDDPRSKVLMIAEAAKLVRDYPWTGVGRGAFEQAVTKVSSRAGGIRMPWAENGYLQSAVDWGLPLALLLGGLACWLLVKACRTTMRAPPLSGALAGLFALGAHEMVDFSVEVAGVAMPALALVGVIFGLRAEMETRHSQALMGMGRVRAWHLVVPLGVLLTVIPAGWVESSLDAEEQLAQMVRKDSVSNEEVLSLGRDVAQRHPAHYYLYALVAERLANERHPETMKWIGTGLYLNPQYAPLHLMAAEVLASVGRKSQALLEYQAAVQTTIRRGPGDIWKRVRDRYHSLDDLLATTGSDPNLTERLGIWLKGARMYEEADAVFQRLASSNRLDARIARHLVEVALLRSQADLAVERAHALLDLDESSESRILAARTFVLAGDLSRAAATLDGVQARISLLFDAELDLANAFSKADDPERARQRLARVEWIRDRNSRRRLHECRARVEERAGNVHQARRERAAAERLKEQRR
ncbi:MAG: O-antigen ligase family protein [Pseudomonadota bacterium]